MESVIDGMENISWNTESPLSPYTKICLLCKTPSVNSLVDSILIVNKTLEKLVFSETLDSEEGFELSLRLC